MSTTVARLASVARRRALRPPEFVQLMSLLANQRMIANGLALEGFTDIWPAIKGRSPTAAVLESLDAPKLVELRQKLIDAAKAYGIMEGFGGRQPVLSRGAGIPARREKGRCERGAMIAQELAPEIQTWRG